MGILFYFILFYFNAITVFVLSVLMSYKKKKKHHMRRSQNKVIGSITIPQPHTCTQSIPYRKKVFYINAPKQKRKKERKYIPFPHPPPLSFGSNVCHVITGNMWQFIRFALNYLIHITIVVVTEWEDFYALVFKKSSALKCIETVCPFINWCLVVKTEVQCT